MSVEQSDDDDDDDNVDIDTQLISGAAGREINGYLC